MPNKLSHIICLVLFGLASCTSPSKTTQPKGDNSMNSLDWNGVYYGILPCADCEGIETVIQLNPDKTYTFQSRYLGRSGEITNSKGSFNWNKEGSKITLSNEQPGIYLVGENKLVHLDKDGRTINVAMADKYILQKKQPGITEKYWKLTEVYGQPISQSASKNKEPHLILYNAENKISVIAGCNNYTGTYELKPNNQVSFGKLAGTLMACQDMETETLFIKALEEADNFFVNENKLILNKAKMAPLAKFEAVYLK